MSIKITLVGAGSYSFGLEILREICSHVMLKNSPIDEVEICLFDINEQRIKGMEEIWNKIKAI